MNKSSRHIKPLFFFHVGRQRSATDCKMEVCPFLGAQLFWPETIGNQRETTRMLSAIRGASYILRSPPPHRRQGAGTSQSLTASPYSTPPTEILGQTTVGVSPFFGNSQKVAFTLKPPNRSTLKNRHTHIYIYIKAHILMVYHRVVVVESPQ